MESPYPTLSSPPFGPTSYGLTIFKPDAVLTAGQLNDWFSFAMAQDQATRARLLGVGVATGLRPSFPAEGSSVSLSAGCGVTTAGHLLRLEQAQTYSRYQALPAPRYLPFFRADQTVLELKPANTPATRPVSELNLSQYAVVLFHHATELAEEKCLNLNCNDNGASYDVHLRVLLVPRAEANATLLGPAAQQAGSLYAQLSPLVMGRFVPAGLSHAARLQAQRGFLRNAATAFGQQLQATALLVRNIEGFRQSDYDNDLGQDGRYEPALLADVTGKYLAESSEAGAGLIRFRDPRTRGLTYVAQWVRVLTARVEALSTDANCQYVYDWLKDLYDAYEEFRQATAEADWLGQAMPAAEAFPRHLVLGELSTEGGSCSLSSRHAWRPSPAVSGAPDAAARVVWLFRRIGALITQFTVPALSSSSPTAGPRVPIDQLIQDEKQQYEVMPVAASKSDATTEQARSADPANAYYAAEAYVAADVYEKETAVYASREAAPYNDGFRFLDSNLVFAEEEDVATGPLAAVPTLRLTPDCFRPTSFDQRSLPFYYNPSLRSTWSYAKTSSCRATHVLSYHPAEAQAPAHVLNPFSFQLDNYDFYRVEGLLDKPAANVMAQLISLREQYNLAFDLVALRADADDTNQPLLAPVANREFIDQQVEFADLLLQLRAGEQGSTVPKPLGTGLTPALSLTTPVATFSTAVTAYLSTTNNPSLPTALRDRALLLQKLNAAYFERLTSLSAQLDFLPFLQANPGLEHGAGVPRGGTFVLVYRTPPATSRGTSTGAALVVADYYLPYRVGSRGPVVQFVLPSQPPSVSLSRNPLSTQDGLIRLDVAPTGGKFVTDPTAAFKDALADPTVANIGGTFYFQPGKITVAPGTFVLRPLYYMTPDGKDSVTACILSKPSIEKLKVVVDNEGVARFSFNVKNATTLSMAFGDGAIDGFNLPVYPGSNPTGAFKFDFTDPTDFRHSYNSTITRVATLTASNGNAADDVRATVQVTFATVEVKLTGENLIMQYEKNSFTVTPPTGGRYTTDPTLLQWGDPGVKPMYTNTYYAPTVGWHKVEYATNSGSAGLELFVLPNSFRLLREPVFYEDKERGSYFLADVELPGLLPDNGWARDLWTWKGEELIRDEDYSVKEDKDKKTTSYRFRLPVSKREDAFSSTLALVFFDTRVENRSFNPIARYLFGRDTETGSGTPMQ